MENKSEQSPQGKASEQLSEAKFISAANKDLRRKTQTRVDQNAMRKVFKDDTAGTPGQKVSPGQEF